MSPEAMSQSIYTTASDVYAFGIVAYEILFEKSAFGSLEGFKVIDAVVNRQ
jgi:serine/threonine protein kinase